MPAVTLTSSLANEIIDLTCSDDESASHRVHEYKFRPLSETPAGERSGEALPEHGLLLDRTFGSFSRAISTSGFSSRHFGNKGVFRPRKAASKSSSRSNEHNRLPDVRRSQDYHKNSAKRRRVELQSSNENLLNNQAGFAEKTSPTGLISADSLSFSVQALELPQQGQYGNKMSKDAMNESLKLALRQQVFPHVNQRLGHYRLSIDSDTRRQLGKKAAWEICGEDFMTNLTQNDGHLSAAFEDKVASTAWSLIDKYAANQVNGSDNSQVAPKTAEHKILLEKLPDFDRKNGAESKTVSGDTSEVLVVEKSAKLSAAMKGRWARGEMNFAMVRKAATLFKKLERNSIPYDHGFSKIRKKLKVPQCKVFSPPSGDRYSTARRRLIVKLHTGETLRQYFTQNIQNSTPAPKQGQYTADLGGRDKLRINVERRSVMEEIRATAANTHHPSNILEHRGRRRASNRQKLAAPAMHLGMRHQIENLRVAGMDKNVSWPYLTWQHRHDIERGLALIQSSLESYAEWSEAKVLALQGSTVQVDFCREEVESMMQVVQSVLGSTSPSATGFPIQDIENLMKGRETIIPKIITALSTAGGTPSVTLFRNRTKSAIRAFLQDAAAGLSSKQPEIKRIDLRTIQTTGSVTSQSIIRSILRQRETWGRRRNQRICVSFKAQLIDAVEDDYVRKNEWTDCSGDIATITWIDSNRFFCGATTHSDAHNMQYNKPGNLLVGTAVDKSLRSVSGHQIVRPIVTNGENSLEAMRGTQDPWMYCSVTSTAYSHDNRKCFTGSYDQTVKVWDIAEDGSSINLCGIWTHSGNVNFVVASKNHSLVATAADVREDAVRVYQFDPNNVTASAFSVYEASVQQRNGSDNWAYFPSTIQWGISSSVSHLLLVGYSPRSFDCHDENIPEDKINSGELCLWDSRDGSRIPITSGRTQNVFEVAWHPTQPIFLAATSPAGTFEEWVKTQLRIFGQTASGSFSHIKTLDGPAIDINEITIMPNSVLNAYVTASCTDGNTYVWDSALSDKPLHILHHGNSIDEFTDGETREESDIGVKFAAWGNNLDRFYTGSSDGVLKAWNIRAPPGHELVRDITHLSGGISAGKFSTDFSKLVIGDSTGKVHLFSLNQDELSAEIPMAWRKPIMPHPPLLAPLIDEDDIEIPPEQSGREISQEFLNRGQITIHEDEWVGAIQGPKYTTTGLLYHAEEYKDKFGQDSKGWSTQELAEKQQLRYSTEITTFPRLLDISSSNQLLHEKNINLDLDVTAILLELLEESVDLNFEHKDDFMFELGLLVDVQDAENNLLEQNQCLDKHEMRVLRVLRKQICQELEVYKGLQDLF